MRLSSSDETKYPRTRRYLRERLPTVVAYDQLRNALKKFGYLGDSELAEVLSYGTTPTIEVVPMAVCGEFHGSFTDGTAMQGVVWNWIQISKKIVTRYEAQPTGRNAQAIGITVLHELAHWGAQRAGRSSLVEDGEEFEKAAYGAILPC